MILPELILSKLAGMYYWDMHKSLKELDLLDLFKGQLQ